MGDLRLKTARLLLRRWEERDREAFAELNAHPEVVEFLPRPLSREESDRLVDVLEQHLEERGYGFWALETEEHPFIGFAGLSIARFEAHFTPNVEVGWRLARGHWGQGYATEAGQAALDIAFDQLALDEVVSYTAINNTRSIAVMKRLGMTHDPEGDFNHPALPEGHPLEAHTLYRIRKS